MPPPLPPQVATAIASGQAKLPDGWFTADPSPPTPRVTAAKRIAAGTVFLFHHACPPAPRPVWVAALAAPGPARDAVAAIAVALPGDDSAGPVLDGRDPLLARLFAWVRPSAAWAGTAARPLPAWLLEPRDLAWARHAEAPTVAVHELEPGTFPGIVSPTGASAVVALADLAPGDEVSRNHALRPSSGTPGHHTLASAAELVGRLPAGRFVHAAEREALAGGVAAAVAATPPPGAARPPPPPRSAHDPRPPPPPLSTAAAGPIPVWTDYPVFAEWLDGEKEGGLFVRTADREAAAVVLTPAPVRDFLGNGGDGSALLPTQRINQFPYEAALIRKDLLPQTLRAHHARSQQGKNTASSSSFHPPWFPPAFDLATEVAWALDHHHARARSAASPAWALKPASASRSVGVCGTASAATLAAFRGAGGPASPADFVAQAAVARPWTVAGRKADLRVTLVVRSFHPPSASLYTGYHARVAPAALPADLGQALVAPGAFSTVACYDEEEDGDDKPADGRKNSDHHDSFLPRPAVDTALASSGADPASVQACIADVAREVVLAGSAAIGGPWPRSGAVYGLDVMLEETEGAENGGGGGGGQTSTKSWEPRLLEVNFCPDPAVMARFRPGLPGELLACMFGVGDGGGGGGDAFVDLFP